MAVAAALSHPGTLRWGSPARRRGPSVRVVPPTVTSPAQRGQLGSGTVRMTRRGRLAVTLTMLAVLASTPLAVLSVVAPADASTEVVVRGGQTLSQVAAAHLPQERVDLAIVRIQRANGLSSNEVQAGQVLQIPSP